MALTDLDRRLLQRCLNHEADAWHEFVDRFLGVIYHVIQHTAHMRSVPLQADEVDDLAADVMARFLENDFKVLRNFRGKASLATYLAVVARRVVVNYLARQAAIRKLKANRNHDTGEQPAQETPPEERVVNDEEVRRLLDDLKDNEAELVRRYYLDHQSYRTISEELGIPENSIGPMLSRIRARLRKAAPNA